MVPLRTWVPTISRRKAADDLGVDELLAVRLAQTCGHAPDRLRGKGAGADRQSLAHSPRLPPEALRGDLATFIEVYGTALPRQAFLPMLEAGIGLGMVNLLLSTAVCLSEWERTGGIPGDQKPMPLLVDCSHGLDTQAAQRFGSGDERMPGPLRAAAGADDAGAGAR
jgi:hypothetical protein